MKRVIITLCSVMFSVVVLAQNNTKISVSAIPIDDPTIPQPSIAMLTNKMRTIAIQNGYGEMQEQRFVLTASVDITEKGYNSAGMLMQKMAITFFIGDVLENKLYSTATVNTMGVGQSDIKVYNMAFQKIVPSHTEIKKMLDDANKQILDYYTTHYSDLISETNRLVEMGQYDEAITKLINVPSICTESFNDAQNRSIEIYRKKMDVLASQQKAKTDKEGLVLIQQAKAAWNSKQDYESASNALALLAQIDPEAGCIEQANEFIQTINAKLRTDERNKAAAEAAIAKRNWEFKMRQYEDNLEMAKQKQADKAAILGTLANRFGKFDINIQKQQSKNWSLGK